MNRIYKKDYIDDLISKDNEIIKNVLDVIENLKSVASSAYSDSSNVPAEAYKGDIKGAATCLKNYIDSDSYDEAKKKLKKAAVELKLIAAADKSFGEAMDAITQNTEKIKGVIRGLNEFINSTPLDTDSSKYQFELSCNMAKWNKVLNDVEEDIEEILKRAKGTEQFSTDFSGDPVNLSSGNFVYFRTDLSYSGEGQFSFKRFYNSINDFEGILGKDWITNYEVRLSFVASNVFEKKEIVIIKEDGKEERFLPVNEKTYTPAANSSAVITIKDDSYEYKTLNGKRYIFDLEGYFTRFEDKNGRGYNLEYLSKADEVESATRFLSVIRKDSGEAFYLDYTEEGYLKSVRDGIGRIVEYCVIDSKLVSVSSPDGTEFKYAYSASGKLMGVENPSGDISVENEYDSQFRVIKQHFPDGTTMAYDYDDEKKTITETERNGAVSVHYHDRYLRNTKNVYPDGEESFVYNSRSRKIQINDKNGNITRMSYDNRGNLTKVINPLGTIVSVTYNGLNKPMTGSVNGKEKFRNRYDEKGNLIEAQDALGRKTIVHYNEEGRPDIITAPDGTFTKIEYDEKGNVIRIINAQGYETNYVYDDLNRVIKVQNPSGDTRSFEYDVMGYIISETNAQGLSRKYKYNKNGKVIEITDYDGKIVKRKYNVLNRPEEVTDKAGRTTRYQYDSMWNVARVTRPDGGKTIYIYNENNRLTRIKDALGNTTRFTYDAMGNRLSIEDQEGNKTFFEYDALNRVTSIKDAEGYKIQYEYDSEDNLVKVINRGGNILTKNYDEMGQLIEEVLVSSDNSVISSKQYSYDVMGNVVSETTESGYVTRYEYMPGTHSITRVVNADGTEVSYTYNPNGYLETKTEIDGKTFRYIYDSLNRLIEIKGTGGHSKKFERNILGNIVSVIDSLGNKTDYEYSLSGKLTKVVDPMGGYIEYSYDSNDRLIGVYQKGEKEDEIRTTEYERNLLGQIETVVDSLGQEAHYKYSGRGELIEKIDKDGFITKYGYTSRGDVNYIQYSDGREVMLSYDAMRHLVEIKDWLGITSIEKDSIGRTVGVTYPDNKKVQYEYNSSGQKNLIRYPDGDEISYNYNELGRLAETAVSFNGGVITGDIKYSYNDFGKIIQKSFSNGNLTKYYYNEEGLVDKLVHMDEEGVLDEYSYCYDSLFNKIEITRNRRGLETENGTYKYEYDGNGRLTTVCKEDELLRSYKYDLFGNRISMQEYMDGNSVITRYNYNALNQLTETTKYLMDNGYSEEKVIEKLLYSYDRRGNLSKTVMDDSEIRYIYGTTNKLEEAIDNRGHISRYYYDGLGNRVRREEYNSESDIESGNPCKKIDYLIDMTKHYRNILGQEEFTDSLEYNESEKHKNEKFIWDGNISGRVLDNQLDYYLKDELGSPIRRMNSRGNLVDSYSYDEFGRTLFENQEKQQLFGYAGYLRDEFLDTYTSHEREYKPEIGRFISCDKVAGIKGYPITRNRYVYCFNNGLSLVDKDGRFPTWGDVQDWWDDTTEAVGNFVNDTTGAIEDWWDDTIDNVETRVDNVVDDAIEWGIDKVNDVGNYLDTHPEKILIPAELLRQGLEKDIIGDISLADAWYIWSTQTEEGNALLSKFNFNMDYDGAYHVDVDCWQQYFGYCNLYDYVFDGFTSMNVNHVKFGNDDTQFVIWMWKGDYYNLGGGGETGIYSGDNWIKKCRTDLNLNMSLYITDNNDNTLVNYTPNDPQWWITGFNPKYQDVDEKDLTVYGVIDFSENDELWRAFLDSNDIDEQFVYYCIDTNSKKLIYVW